MSTTQWIKKPERPGRVMFMDGNGDLPKIEVDTAVSSAEIYLHGGHVTHFQKRGETPILFLSQVSRFQSGQPIRGGVPVIFPWFGSREGSPSHGFARGQNWDLREIRPLSDGGVMVRLRLPDSAEASLLPRFTAEYLITVSHTLSLELIVTNTADRIDFPFENCLHTYFSVGDVRQASITGLQGVDYLDKTEKYARHTETQPAIRVAGEVDRIYLSTPGAVEILDPALGRRLTLQKSGSQSTVVWNPWEKTAQQMPDFGNDEYLRMICVESGNVSDNRITLPPGQSSSLRLEISSSAL